MGLGAGVVACLIIVSSLALWLGGLFDYSVKPDTDLSRSRLGLVRLLTRTAKARFGQVGYYISQVKDQVGQNSHNFGIE